ncbi:MAG: nodulation protein NfeD [Bdellovibrionales bacterium]|nr:nodulation protein NfeD [Bdellovibrionales bacterium]
MKFLNLNLYFIIFLILFNINFATASEEKSNTFNVRNILVQSVNSSINPAIYSYLKEGQKEARNKSTDLILIKLNTPGGLVSTTKEIINLIGESNIPYIVWITPEGASATSAGAIIASAAHLLFMSEGTNIGAATPIQMSGDIKENDLRNKAVNDLVALVQSLSEARGRQGKLFGDMVEKASSFKSREAYQKKLINGIINNNEELLKIIDGQEIILKGQKVKIKISSPELKYFEMDLGQKILDIFADPSMAYILFLIGAALLYLELQAPGGFLAGSVGAICLILAGIGFQVLPLNFGALGLIVLSFILFILEVYITSYGLLSLAGIASLIFGSLFLYRTNDAYITVSTTMIASAVTAIVIFLGGMLYFIIYDRKKNKDHHSFNQLIGKPAIIMTMKESPTQSQTYEYQVKISSEIWKASSINKYEIGSTHLVTNQNKETLILEI